MTLTNTKKARKFFEAKMKFTTGPVELNELIKTGQDIKIIDVRATEDFHKDHIPGSVSLPKERWATFTGLSREKLNIVYCFSSIHLIIKQPATPVGHFLYVKVS